MLRSRKSVLAGASAVLAIAVLVAGPAWSAGFSVFEQGARATARGGAFVATADDPSAMFYNPAGLASNDKLTVMAGATLLIPDSSLDGLNPYPGVGYSASQEFAIYYPPNFYVAMPIGKCLNLSFGTWFPFGLSTNWEDPNEFAGRFISQRVDVRQFAVGLQLAWGATDWLSIGAGPELRLSDVKLQRNVPILNPFTNRVVDAVHIDINSDGFETDLGWAAGIMLTPHKCFRIGASYHSQVTANFEGPAIFYQLPTGSAQLDAVMASRLPLNVPVDARTAMEYPAVTQLGMAVDVNDQLTVDVAAVYMQWNIFEKTELSFGSANGLTPPGSVIHHNWENAWSFRLGGTYKFSPKVEGSAGFVYDQTPQPDPNTGPLLPDSNRSGYSVGVSWKIGEVTYLDFSYMALYFHERTITTNEHNFNAVYNTFAHLPAFNLRTAF